MEYLKELNIKDLKPLNGFHNKIFKGVYKSSEIVIRKASKSRRSLKEVTSEIEFLNDISVLNFVIKPFAIKGKYVIEKDEHIYLFYEFIEGKVWHELEHTPDIIEEAGSNLALLHQMSISLDKPYQRKSFEQHPDLDLYLEYYHNKSRFIEVYRKTLEEINKIEKTKNSYGLVHGDYLYSNMIYKTPLTIIDFDDIEYGYYLYDIAVYMFYYLLGGDPLNINLVENTQRFNAFLKGYKKVRNINRKHLSYLNPFFRLRQMKLLGTIQTYLKDNLGPWQEKYIELSEKMIENGIPFISQ